LAAHERSGCRHPQRRRRGGPSGTTGDALHVVEEIGSGMLRGDAVCPASRQEARTPGCVVSGLRGASPELQPAVADARAPTSDIGWLRGSRAVGHERRQAGGR
jgi:hypothetical protein